MLRHVGAKLRPMTRTAFMTSPASFADASDDLDIVPAHIAARRMQRRLMAVASALAVLVLAVTLYQGAIVLRTPPDLVTFAFRV